MTYPIPTESLDDRLGVLGTAGSGKTYSVLGAFARLLKRGSRAIAFDALGVMYGIRLAPDGVSPSSFKPVIFGGPHGDLPLTVGAASLIGETIATMAESVILDLSEIGSKSAERRFMLGVLQALYKHADKEPVHLLFDEADLWAPQKVFDKEGEAYKLLGMMEQIVRRGRIKGFIPWLITQRPAVLSKDVLSQADGIVAMKLTASQDRDAIGAWIEGQADRAKGKEILALLPTMNQGEGVIWIPGRSILKTATFPKNATYDSSRTPKRGESVRKVDLKPLDLGKLKDRLAHVEQEAKANDPGALRARVLALEADLRKAAKGSAKVAAPSPDSQEAKRSALESARRAGALEGGKAGYATGWVEGYQAGHRVGFGQGAQALRNEISDFVATAHDIGVRKYVVPTKVPKPPKSFQSAPLPPFVDMTTQTAAKREVEQVARHRPPIIAFSGVSGSEAKFLRVLAWWESMGKPTPTRAQVFAVAGWAVTSGHPKNMASALRTKGLIEYPGEGLLCLTNDGRAVAPAPGDMSIIEGVRSVLNGTQRKVFDLLLEHRRAMSREEICAAMEPPWSPASGHPKNILSSMKTLEVITYPSQGSAMLADWIV